jgi:hypothetical protein
MVLKIKIVSLWDMIVFYVAQQHPVGHGLLIHEFPKSQTTTQHSLPPDEWTARRTDLYLKTYIQKSMPSTGFEPTISADERSQIHALDRTATGTGAIW